MNCLYVTFVALVVVPAAFGGQPEPSLRWIVPPSGFDSCGYAVLKTEVRRQARPGPLDFQIARIAA
jgi:hypothetical protein